MLEGDDEYTDFMLTEIWIRPTITYGLIACFVTEKANPDDDKESRVQSQPCLNYAEAHSVLHKVNNSEKTLIANRLLVFLDISRGFLWFWLK